MFVRAYLRLPIYYLIYTWQKVHNMKFLKLLFARLSLRGTEFDPILFHVGFVMDKVSQGQILFEVFLHVAVRVIPYNRISLICHSC